MRARGRGRDCSAYNQNPMMCKQRREVLQSKLEMLSQRQGSRCQTSKTTGAHCTFKKDSSLRRESFKPMVSSLLVSNNWDFHSTQLSSLAYSPVLTPYQYSLPNLPSGGPASLSALWGPRCSQVCAVAGCAVCPGQ